MEIKKLSAVFIYLFILKINIAFAVNEQAANPPPIDWQITHNSDGWYGFQGGLKDRASYLNQSDVRVELDMDKLMHLKDYSALIEAQNIYGLRPNLYVDSLQGFDNIEYDRFGTMTYLYQLWLQRQIGKHWSLLAGFYDLNSEFYLTDSSTLLILPAFGTATDLGQTGPNGPSIFPVIGTAVRAKFAPTTNTYFQAALFDAAAANPLNRAYAYFPFSSGYGLLGIYEMGYLFLNKKDGSSQGKIALGIWGYDKQVPVQAAPGFTSLRKSVNNFGIYTMLDYPLFTDTQNAKKNIRGFIRFGTASSLANNFGKSLSAGLTISGFIPKRDNDVISMGLAPAWTTPNSRLANPGLSNGEFQYELTYSAAITEWFILQPDLIYISFPNADHDDFQNALLLGIRVTINVEKIKDK